VRIGRAQKMRQAGLGAQEGASGIHLVHEVEPLQVGRQGRGRRHGAGVVDQDVDAAEPGRGRRHRGQHRFLGADVADQGQGLAAGRLQLRSGGEHGPGQPRMRLGGLAQDRHVGAIPGGPQADGQANAAAAAGDEKSLA
jgi:hypothetical protein